MEAIVIKGKKYVMVNERLKAFREEHKEWSLISDVVSLTEEICVIKASILDENGRVIATGLAQEDRQSSMINNTSYVENCETSAWGRALANLGYGIDTSVASANEVAMAIEKQELNETLDVIGGDYVVQIGKHKGKAIKDIPSDWLDWYLQNGFDEYIKKNILSILIMVPKFLTPPTKFFGRVPNFLVGSKLIL